MPKEAKQQYQHQPQAGDAFKARFHEAMCCLAKALDENRELSALELVDLQATMNWHPSESARQLKRLAKRRHWRAIAGTPADREAAQQAIEDSRRILQARRPDVEAEIDRLSRELSKLENDVSRAERRHTEMLDALQSSRQTLPDELQKLHSRQRAEIKARHWPAINTALTELGECRAAVTKDVNKDLHLINAKFHGFDQVRKKTILLPSWGVYREECRARLPELEQQLQVLEAAMQAELAQFDASCDCGDY